jgi:hypothetical protein
LASYGPACWYYYYSARIAVAHLYTSSFKIIKAASAAFYLISFPSAKLFLIPNS